MRTLALLLVLVIVAVSAQDAAKDNTAAVVPSQAEEWYNTAPIVQYCEATLRSAKAQISQIVPESVAFAPWSDSKDLSNFLMINYWVLFIPKALVAFFNVIGTFFASAGKPRTVLRSLEFVTSFAMGATVVIYSMVWHGVGAGGAKTNVSTLTIFAIAMFDVLTAVSASVYTATTVDDKFTKVMILFNMTIQGLLIISLPQNVAGQLSWFPTIAGMLFILAAFHLTHADHLMIHSPETSESRSFARRILEGTNTSVAYIYVGAASVLLVLYGASTTYAPSFTLTKWSEQPGAMLLAFVFVLQAISFLSISIRMALHKSDWFRGWLPDYVESQFNYGAIKTKKLRQTGSV